MNKKKVFWQLELALNKEGKKKKTIYLVVETTEKWADIILEVIIFGFEERGFIVGGGMVRVFDE